MGNCVEVIGYAWCSVSYSFAFVSMGFSLLTGYQIARNIKAQGVWVSKSLAILYVQMLQTIMMFVHYVVIGPEFNILYMLMEYLQFVLDTIIFFYFAFEATKVHQSPGFYKRFIKPLLVFNILYLTGFAVYFIVGNIKSEDVYSCQNGIWVYMRLSGLMLTLVFFIIGIRMTKKLRDLKKLHCLIIDTSREKELW